MYAKLFVSISSFLLLSMPAAAGDWDHYGGDAGGTRFSALSEITRENVDDLEIAWTFRTGELGEGYIRGPNLTFEATPVLWNGTLYVSTAFDKVFAIDAATGAGVWSFDPKFPKDRRSAETASRGVSIWHDPVAPADAACAHRVFIGTLDARLIALDALTGERCTEFGSDGEVDLTQDVGLKDRVDYTVTSPPALYRDLVITGSAIGDNRAIEVERGIVRGFDARTGELRWMWDPIPRDDSDPEYRNWDAEAARITGGANAWSILSVDHKRGLVFVPTGAPSPDFYGGERPGDTRYANSVVALNAGTGEMVWHFQTVHHDIWDYDVASQPSLIELRRDGEMIPAVAQATKQGMLFVLHRETGEPLFPVEERAVPQGGVPGERLSPTQPFSTLPALVDGRPVTEDDAWGILPWNKSACRDRIRKYRSEGIFTPPSFEGTIESPGYAGGSNWGSVAYDPDHQFVIANVMNVPMIVTLHPREDAKRLVEEGVIREYSDQRGTPYVMSRDAFLSDAEIPCVRPPWGKLMAVDLKSGAMAWEVPLGTIEDIAPAIVPNLNLGVPNAGGPIVTAAGLIFIGAAADDYLRAFDVETGKELWKGRLPAGGQATPMTYQAEGRQFVVIAAGGHGGFDTTRGDYVVAFALPAKD